MDASLITLSDGRNLAYAEYGKSDDIPVLYFHGTPGAYLLPEGDAAIAKRLGLRLICPGRPGIGLSDFQPRRKLLDWPDDIVALADNLTINKFGVIGYSGGATHRPRRTSGTGIG